VEHEQVRLQHLPGSDRQLCRVPQGLPRGEEVLNRGLQTGILRAPQTAAVCGIGD
jgi:hypothetical protein